MNKISGDVTVLVTITEDFKNTVFVISSFSCAHRRTKKFDRRLTQLTHVDLHWLDVPERVKYKLVSIVHNCLHQKAPQYLTDCCIPISDVASRRSGTRCLTNSEIRRVVLTVLSSFLRQPCLVFTNVTSALEVFLNVMRYINPLFTYFTYSRRHLRCARRHHLVVPRHNLSTYGRRAFAVAAWPGCLNSLSDDLRDSAMLRQFYTEVTSRPLYNGNYR